MRKSVILSTVAAMTLALALSACGDQAATTNSTTTVTNTTTTDGGPCGDGTVLRDGEHCS